MFKRFLASTFALVLTLTLIFAPANDAMAARSGGRIGGGSFRRSAPARTYSTPARQAPVGGGYGYGFGGGFGFPFLLPFFGFGGFSGIFGIFIMLAIAGFLVRTFQSVMAGNAAEADSVGASYAAPSNEKISVAKVQVGLLAQARDLQKDLDKLAATADTGTPAGRAKVLQESTLALLRHPEYWVYGSADYVRTGVDAAEAKFNQLALGERSKFTAETLSNVNNERNVQAKSDAANLVKSDENNEYIMVTLIVGALGKLDLPTINDSSDLEKAIRQVGALGGDRLLAIEILWTPQAEGDTITSDDIMTYYPDIKLV